MASLSTIGDSKPFTPSVHASQVASLNYLVTHVFLPVRLPDEDDYTLQNDLSLIHAVSAAAHSYSTLVSEPIKSHWYCIINMLDNFKTSIQSERLERDHIIAQLQRMQTGDTLTFFVRRQRAALVVTRREETTLCEPFEVPPSEDAVLKSEGPLVCSYPRSAVEMRNKVFDDMELHYELASFLSRPNATDSDLPSPSPGDPQYVTALLAGTLRGVGRAVDVPRIVKRVRDDVVGSFGSATKWRRSPLWLLVRVTIQMSLERSFGRSSHKEFLLYFISTLAMDSNRETLSNDLLHLMECKILRRLSKLGPSTPVWLSEMALKTCTHLRQVLDARWEQPSISSPFRNPSQDELARDSQVSFLNCEEYVCNALSNPDHKSVGTPFNPNHRRRGTIDDFLSSDGIFFEEAYRADPKVTLYDVERSVEQGIDDWLAHVIDPSKACAQLEILMDKYMQIIQVQSVSYQQPEVLSTGLLTMVELFLALDKLVIREIPILADYSPEILLAFLERLFLRTTTSLHRLSRAYQYLSARHSFSRPGWSVLSDEFTENSFPVRYYDQSPHLQHLKARIEGDAIWATTEHSHEKEDRSLTYAYDVYHHGDATPKEENSQSPLPTSLLQAKVIVFELQCPVYCRIWWSAVSHILLCFFHPDPVPSSPYIKSREKKENLLSHSPRLRPYFIGNDRPSLRWQLQFSCIYPKGLQLQKRPTLRYTFLNPDSQAHTTSVVKAGDYDAYYVWNPDVKYRGNLFNSDHTLGHSEVLSSNSEITKRIRVDRTPLTPNHAMTSQVYCPTDLSLEEFLAFAHLQNPSGSIQWFNILHGLRSRALNLRHKQVYHLLSHTASQVGPLDTKTGMWIWHQELQNPSFCNALLDEINSLFIGFGAESVDAIMMGSISLLLTRILASSPSEGVSEQAIDLLRNVRKKTFMWVEELLYNLAMAPTNMERCRLLLDMAATCRNTFDLDTTGLSKVFHSAEDIDAALSCALFVHSLRPESPDESYLELLLQRDQRLSFALEEALSDVILADPSEYGIDLAIRRMLGRYQPCVNRWQRLLYPNGRWLSCQTEVVTDIDQPLQELHLNLFDGSLRVDGRPLAGLPLAIREAPECQEIFHDQGFIVLPSDLPGMEFMTHITSSKRKVHYSLRDDILVLRVQYSGSRDILELIPSYILRKDLPLSLVDGHIHWLNLSTRVIEIRPIERLWDESPMNWRIDCTDGQYRIYKGCETLVDIRSPTWAMISQCFDPLSNINGLRGKSRNLLITTSPTGFHNSLRTLLSVRLPRYGLSFFVNIRGELESHDFKDMVYDENQYAGALFGLKNILILRSKRDISDIPVPEALIPRRILVPDGLPERYGAHKVQIRHNPFSEAVKLFCHTYNVDVELGCLIGNGSLSSAQYLALLHAVTSRDRPDPLTSKTGTQAALSLLRLAGFRSVMRFKNLQSNKISTDFSDHHPYINSVHSEILDRYYWLLERSGYSSGKATFKLGRGGQRAAYLFQLPNATGSNSHWQEDRTDLDLELQDVSSIAASVIYRWSMNSPTLTPMLNWEELWDGTI